MKLKTKLSLLSRLTCYGTGTLSFCKQLLSGVLICASYSALFDVTINRINRRKLLNSLMLGSNQINMKYTVVKSP